MKRTTNRSRSASFRRAVADFRRQLGQAIRRRRIELGMSQHELAELAKVNGGQTVSRWERGLNAPQDYQAVADALRMPLSELMSDLEIPSPKLARRLNLGLEGPYESDRLARIESRLEHVAELVESIAAWAQQLGDFRTSQALDEAERQGERKPDEEGRRGPT